MVPLQGYCFTVLHAIFVRPKIRQGTSTRFHHYIGCLRHPTHNNENARVFLAEFNVFPVRIFSLEMKLVWHKQYCCYTNVSKQLRVNRRGCSAYILFDNVDSHLEYRKGYEL